jgi:hypothetical protein
MSQIVRPASRRYTQTCLVIGSRSSRRQVPAHLQSSLHFLLLHGPRIDPDPGPDVLDSSHGSVIAKCRLPVPPVLAGKNRCLHFPSAARQNKMRLDCGNFLATKIPDKSRLGAVVHLVKGAASRRHGDPRNIRPHSITWSARASKVGGILRPSFLALRRLTTSSIAVGCSMGSSAGLAPFRMRATKYAVRR